MTPAVIIPAFDLRAGTWHRVNALKILREHLSGLGWRVFTETGTTAGHARNRGAAHAWNHDILVFNDADTFVPVEQIRVAASLAADSPGLVFAFTEYTRLSEAATATVNTLDDVFTIEPSEQYFEPPSHGCVAISRAAFVDAGGYDERLEAFEDCALTQVCEQRWPSRRVDGRAVHMFHPRYGDTGDPVWEERFAASREIWEREYLGPGRV